MRNNYLTPRDKIVSYMTVPQLVKITRTMVEILTLFISRTIMLLSIKVGTRANSTG